MHDLNKNIVINKAKKKKFTDIFQELELIRDINQEKSPESISGQ